MEPNAHIRWLRTGDEALTQMVAAIREARESVQLEMYMINPSPIAEQFRQALVSACQRGVKVQVLADAVGSIDLPDGFWKILRLSGGEIRWFNPLTLHRIAFRDHRKTLVCDQSVAFIGGFNIGTEYLGDGVTKGWCDLGLVLEGAFAMELSAGFDEMFQRADFKHYPFARLRKSRQKIILLPEGNLLLSEPGRNSPIKRALREDLKKAARVQILCAYFLPTWRIRHELLRAARRGAQVQLILPGKTDVPLSYFAAQRFYGSLLRAGVEVYEYQPQILHAKTLIIDDIVFAGSCNLDSRSLNINYELFLRVPNPRLAAEGREIFAHALAHSRRIDLQGWRKSRTLFNDLKVRWAYFILARVDPYIARYQWRRILATAKNKILKMRRSRKP